MKKNWIYAIIVIVLIVISGILYFSQRVSNSTIPKPLRDFAIEDTTSITKIFMVNKANQQVILERKNSHWILDNEYVARKDLIDLLLKTINRIKVRSPVSRSAHDNVVKVLATTATKVEIYRNYEEKPAKVFYVGHPTQDNMGTYMLMENSSVPFIMHIPGFIGYLTSRFTVVWSDWRDLSIYRYKFTDIASVTMEHPGSPERSFKAINYGDNKFDLKPLNDSIEITGFDTLKLKKLIASFKKINCEYYITKFDKHKEDSVRNSQPINIIIVEDIYGTEITVTTFHRPNLSGLLDEEGKEYEYDVDRMYAFINGNKDLVVIQYFVFDPLTLNLNDLLMQSN